MNEKSKQIKIQMTLNATTIKRVKELMELTDMNNKTQVVADAIALYHKIETAVKNEKAEIFMEYPGKETRDKLILVR
jgi:hypothetical protein